MPPEQNQVIIRLQEPFLVLNGDKGGWVNSLTVPSVVAPSYAPPGRSLISIVEKNVRQEMIAWFGPQVEDWRHLKTHRIHHALPEQTPPAPNPTKGITVKKRGIYVCGEYSSVPGIQWALLSGRQAAEFKSSI